MIRRTRRSAVPKLQLLRKICTFMKPQHACKNENGSSPFTFLDRYLLHKAYEMLGTSFRPVVVVVVVVVHSGDG